MPAGRRENTKKNPAMTTRARAPVACVAGAGTGVAPWALPREVHLFRRSAAGKPPFTCVAARRLRRMMMEHMICLLDTNPPAPFQTGSLTAPGLALDQSPLGTRTWTRAAIYTPAAGRGCAAQNKTRRTRGRRTAGRPTAARRGTTARRLPPLRRRTRTRALRTRRPPRERRARAGGVVTLR